MQDKTKTALFEPNYKREIFTILFAHKKVICYSMLFIFVCSVGIALLWPPTYSAFGSLLIKGKKLEKSPEALEKAEVRNLPIEKEDLYSEAEILTSPDVIQKTINYLKANNLYKKEEVGKYSFDVLKEKLSKLVGQLIPSYSAKDTAMNGGLYREIYAIKSNIKTEILPSSNVIQITLFNKDHRYAVILLETLMDQYLKYRSELYNPLSTKSFYSVQVDDYRNGIDEKEKELLAIVEENQAVNPEKEIENNLVLKKTLQEQLNIVEYRAIEKSQNLALLDKTLASKKIEYFSFISNNAAILGLGKSLQTLVVEQKKILSKYLPESEQGVVAEKQIKDTYDALKNEVISYRNSLDNDLKIINEKLKKIKREIADIDAQNIKLHKQFIAEERIKRDIDVYKMSYETFFVRREEARITTSTDAANFFVSIIKKAFPSNGPVFPKPILVVPFGVIIGFITGFTFAFLIEFFDHTFKKPEDVFKYAGLPVLFSIEDIDVNVPK
ncbi:MAG: GumC family protein [Candidatus Magnetoovum sp. WYHC-5]|nr:GumC family protein [Candidatus Magnetoovum sp. WYHC-5]